MEQDIIRIAVIVLLTWGIWAINNALTYLPNIKQIISIIIILVGCLFLITPLVDVVSLALNSVHGK